MQSLEMLCYNLLFSLEYSAPSFWACTMKCGWYTSCWDGNMSTSNIGNKKEGNCHQIQFGTHEWINMYWMMFVHSPPTHFYVPRFDEKNFLWHIWMTQKNHLNYDINNFEEYKKKTFCSTHLILTPSWHFPFIYHHHRNHHHLLYGLVKNEKVFLQCKLCYAN